MAMGFGDELRRFEKEVISGSEQVIKNVFIRAGLNIIQLTPVDTFKAISNWFPARNSISTKTTEDTNGFTKRRQEVRRVAQGFKLGDYLSITNSLPYINRLENGYSNQAPSGMVKITSMYLDQWIREEARNL